MSYKWTLIRRFYDGHSYWRELNRKDLNDLIQIAIADQSGMFDYPDETEYGVLWLDLKGIIKTGEQSFSIPLLDKDLKPCSTIASPKEAVWVMNHFGLKML